MRKYIAAVVLIFSLAIYVSSNYKKHSNDAASNAEKPADKTLTAHDGQDAKTDAGQTIWNPPRWYRLFSWPDGIQAWGLFLTLIVIAEQTSQTARAARATESSVRTFVVSQGPQILVKAHGRPPDDFFADPPRIQLEMQNQGPTTARGVRYEFWIEVLPGEFVDFTPAANYHKTEHSISVYPSQQPVIMNIPLGRVISSAERQGVKDLEKKVCVRIRVEYRDIFSSDTQVANFGYWMQGDGLGFLPKYNDGDTQQQAN